MRLKIKRFDGNISFFEEFEVEVKDDETILEVLDKINRKKRDITYRSFCRSSICGCCAIRVNQKSVLACKAKAKDLVQNDTLLIEPLNNLRVLKDLVVEHNYIETSHKKLNNFFVDTIDENKENLQLPNELKMYDKQTDCILCMACFSECEALLNEPNFAGPFAFSKVYRFVYDNRDKMDKQKRIEIAKLNNLYSCVSCQMCYISCPKGISSMNDIKLLQTKDENPPFETMDFVSFF